MSKIGVEEAYNIGREAFNKGLDLHNIDPSEFTPIEWDNVVAGYNNSIGEDEPMDEDMNLYNDPDELDFN